MWESAMMLFEDYMGTGLITAFFLIMVVYLFFVEKDPAKRILFIYMPIVFLLLYFNPLFCRIVYGFIGDEIYYRILWLLPVTLVLAYGIVCFYKSFEGKIRYAILLLAVVCILPK